MTSSVLLYAHREQHVTFGDGLHCMRHVRIQHDSLAIPQPVQHTTGLDAQRAPKTVNHDMTWGPMLRQATAGLECEQQDPKRPPMDQASLVVTALRRLGFGA